MWHLKLEFCIPTDANEVRLQIAAPGWEKILLIGDESRAEHQHVVLASAASGGSASAVSMPEFSSSFLHD